MTNSIEVVVSLRPQVDYAVSLASTLSRQGVRICSDWFDEEVSRDNHRYDYDRLETGTKITMLWTDITRKHSERRSKRYSSDTTDEAWAVIAPLLPGGSQEHEIPQLILNRTLR